MSENWTTENIPNLSGKVAIVTGANSGIGFETAKALAKKRAVVVLACRDREKADAAAGQIRQEHRKARIKIIKLDLANLSSIQRFTDIFKSKCTSLDLLINNAGIMWVPQSKTADGFERQFGTNHLGHFALTGLLMDHLLKTPGARVVNISSVGHRAGVMDFEDLMYLLKK